MRNAIVLSLLIALACGRRETAETPAATTATAGTTAASATAAPQPPPAQWTRAEIGAALNVDPAKAAAQSSMTVAKDGAPVVAWREQAAIYVKQWNGSQWQQLGGALQREPAREPVVLTRGDGTIVALWVEMPNGLGELHGAAWNGTAWSRLGGKANAQPLVRYAAAESPAGIVVAALERTSPEQHQLFVRRWNGSTWQQLGGGAMNAIVGGFIGEAPAVAAIGSGDVALAWLERVPASGVTLQMRRWSESAKSWSEMPSPGNVDGDSRIALSSDGSGNLVLVRTWNGGLRPFAIFDGVEWRGLAHPDPKMELGGGMPVTLLAPAPDGFATLTWWSGALQLARFDGSQWTIAAPSVQPEAHKGWDPGLAVAPDGTMYVSWIDTRNEPALLMAARYSR